MSYPTNLMIKANSKLDFQISEIEVRQQDALTSWITKGQRAHSAHAGLKNQFLHMYLCGLYPDIFVFFFHHQIIKDRMYSNIPLYFLKALRIVTGASNNPL